jgi:ComEC/Rec2-related protein
VARWRLPRSGGDRCCSWVSRSCWARPPCGRSGARTSAAPGRHGGRAGPWVARLRRCPRSRWARSSSPSASRSAASTRRPRPRSRPAAGRGRPSSWRSALPAMAPRSDPRTRRGRRSTSRQPPLPEVSPGQVVGWPGARPPPDGEYGDWLRRSGVVATLRAVSLAPMAATNGPGAALEGLRRGSGRALALALPANRGAGCGILVGLRDEVDRGVAAAFGRRRSVVAISGWNIAIVAATIGARLGRFGRRPRTVTILVAIVAYTAFAGASPSVVRAAAMAGVVLLARESGRAGRAAAALGLAAAILLLVDPGLVADAGFQLSVLATAGLLAWATPLRTRLERLTRGRAPGWLLRPWRSRSPPSSRRCRWCSRPSDGCRSSRPRRISRSRRSCRRRWRWAPSHWPADGPSCSAHLGRWASFSACRPGPCWPCSSGSSTRRQRSRGPPWRSEPRGTSRGRCSRPWPSSD